MNLKNNSNGNTNTNKEFDTDADNDQWFSVRKMGDKPKTNNEKKKWNKDVCQINLKTEFGRLEMPEDNDPATNSILWVDFWEDMETWRDHNDDYSTDQYFDISIHIIDDHADSEDSFFICMIRLQHIQVN